MMKNIITGLLLVVLILPVHAQRKQTSSSIVKKPLTHAAYDEWKSITYKELTNDGKYAAYTLNPEAADGKLILMDLSKNTSDEVPRAENIKQSWDSRYSFMLIKPQKDLVKELRREKKKKEDMPKDTLGIYSWANKKLVKIPHVKSYKIPEKTGGWIAYQLEAITETEKEKTNGNGHENSDKAKPSRKISDENGYPLVLSNLDNGQQMTFGFVKDYTFAKNGAGLLFHTTGDNGELQPGIYWYDLNEEKLLSIFEANRKHKFKYLSIDESGSKVAFIADLDTTKALVREPKLYYWDKSQTAASILADKSTAEIPEKWLVSENFNPYFSKDGSKLFFGTNPVPIVKDTALLAEEIVNVEVWHWQDDYIYPEQNVRADRDRKRSYLAVMHLENRKLVQLGNEKMSDINVGNEGNSKYALGKDDRAYRISRTWDTGGGHDLYLVNVADGSSKMIESGVQGYSRLSPSAQYAYWFSNPDTAWFAHHIASGKTLKLTSGMTILFADEENDVPDYPSSYGLAGWTKDDARVLIYDKYDIWSFDPQGKDDPINLTKDGRATKHTYRYVNLDREKQFIDQDEVMLLTAFDEKSKSSGYVRYSLKDRKLNPLVMSAHRYGGIQKANDADLYLYTRENFQEFPDLYVADLNFSKPKKISEANPQQKEYIWGTAELVYWNSLDNIPLEGILYKPENFDPNKKYPMVVVYYERFSNTIHQHHKPEPIRSLVHRTMYVSNDYLIFVPDVVYSTGYPGESAFNCIIPGVTNLISQGFVDKDRVGIQGHSWSGYQTAYILTRTNMFRAAEAGAIVANMTSAYGGIRWESGRARMFQYEKAQSRLGVSLWDNPLPYIENSPLFFANKIETPILLLHNDADGAVPWYQGIEMYLAMRRLNKPTWMLNYNGEPHWPVKRENRIDFQTRMMQFFDYYLKDAAMPRWMERGVPAIEKGIYQGLELVGDGDGI
jgi:dipeptidyl aminopeptidase/acylaminoacyl peptidase